MDFNSQHPYVQRIRESLRNGTPIPDPTTWSGLRAAVRAFPFLARRLRPAKDEILRLGRDPADYGWPPQRLGNQFREQFLEILDEDPEFNRQLARRLHQ